MIFIAEAIGQREAWRYFPVVLRVEVVVNGEAVIVGSHNVISCSLRCSDQEIGKLLAGRNTQPGEVVARVVEECAVIISTEKTERRERFDMSDIEAVLHAV